jgi:1-acyl-sn-glycerol-3-phosphate acyltransferase
MRVLQALVSTVITAFARIVTGVRPDWRGTVPEPGQRIYFANHASHGDFVLIWSVLPKPLRDRTRPVAGADYWSTGRLRRFVGTRVFRAVLIDRGTATRRENPLDVLSQALGEGDSLILFPEGTRNTTDATLLPFRSGLYHLARRHPGVALVPAWIDNISRVLPKGEVLPVPLLCSVTFGEPIHVHLGEDRRTFLERARTALLALSGHLDATVAELPVEDHPHAA